MTETRTRKPKPLTVCEARELLEDLYYEIDNRGGNEGRIFRRAHDALAWLLAEYFQFDRAKRGTFGEANRREKREAAVVSGQEEPT